MPAVERCAPVVLRDIGDLSLVWLIIATGVIEHGKENDLAVPGVECVFNLAAVIRASLRDVLPGRQRDRWIAWRQDAVLNLVGAPSRRGKVNPPDVAGRVKAEWKHDSHIRLPLRALILNEVMPATD